MLAISSRIYCTRTNDSHNIQKELVPHTEANEMNTNKKMFKQQQIELKSNANKKYNETVCMQRVSVH